MTRTQRERMFTVIIILVAVALIVALVAYALGQNLNWFYTPSQLKEHKQLVGRSLRLGGVVVPGSAKFGNDLSVSFQVQDESEIVKVHYRGTLPDLFREGQVVVVSGILESLHELRANQVLAKHDQNYKPVELDATVQSIAKASSGAAL